VLAAGPAIAGSFDPAAPSVTAGQLVAVTLSDTIDINDAIGAVDLEVDFDPSVLSFTSADVGDLLSGWSIFSNTSSPGVALISASEPPTALSDPSGTGSVVVLDFAALANDATTLTAVSVTTAGFAQGVFGEYQLPSSGFDIAVTAAPVIAALPAPGLAALALPTLALLRIRRRPA
jgi:hypothetical protein